MRTGEVSHDVTIFSGAPLCHFMQLESGLRYQKTSLLEHLRGGNMPLSSQRKAELEKSDDAKSFSV